MKNSFKPYRKKIFLVLASFTILLLTLLLNYKLNRQLCKDIVVVISHPVDQQLVDEQMVKDEIIRGFPGGLVGLPMSKIPISAIEEKLAKMQAVQSVEASTTLDGNVQISITQRIPIVRVYTSPLVSYYLDVENYKIQSKGVRAARVPLAQVHTAARASTILYTFSKYVHENTFAQSIIEQIFVNNSGDIKFITNLGDFDVVIGDTTYLDNKFERLQTFMKNGLSTVGWEKYKEINVQFENQIVCKK